jgi:hypothetical protein
MPGNVQQKMASSVTLVCGRCRPRKVVSVDAMDTIADWPTRLVANSLLLFVSLLLQAAQGGECGRHGRHS